MAIPNTNMAIFAMVMLSCIVNAGLAAFLDIFIMVAVKHCDYFHGWKGLCRAPLVLVCGFHLLIMSGKVFNYSMILSLAFLLSHLVNSLEEPESSDADEFHRAGSTDMNENDERKEIGFVDMGLIMLLQIMMLRLVVNLVRTLIASNLWKLFAKCFLIYQTSGVLISFLFEGYVENYFGVSSSSTDLREDLESSDANESHGVVWIVETNDSDKSELDTNGSESEVGSSDTNESDESEGTQSEVDENDTDESDNILVMSNDVDEIDASEVDTNDEREDTQSEVDENGMDESGIILVTSNERNESRVDTSGADESDEREVESRGTDENQSDDFYII